MSTVTNVKYVHFILMRLIDQITFKAFNLYKDCGVSLASNADNAGGCFPLNDHIYCKNCNLTRLRGFPNAQGYYYKLPGKQIASNITPRSTDL
jgi:hypothetical protein